MTGKIYSYLFLLVLFLFVRIEFEFEQTILICLKGGRKKLAENLRGEKKVGVRLEKKGLSVCVGKRNFLSEMGKRNCG